MAQFPSPEWVQIFKDKLNTDAQYAEIARNWEGDVFLTIEPGESLENQIDVYLDLWHGKCREAYILENGLGQEAAFMLRGVYENYLLVLNGNLHPMQAMLTRKLSVRGNMGLLMRNVPTVLDFVRCAQEITEIPD